MTKTFTPSRAVPSFPGAATLGLSATNLIEVGHAVEAGLEPAAVERFSQHLGLSLGETLRLLGLGEGAYHRRKRKGLPLLEQVQQRRPL